jgi:phosphoribosylanthranilate isomerase
MTLIKICGITNTDDAIACAELGVDMLGFIFADSPRRVDTGTAAGIIGAVRRIDRPGTLAPDVPLFVGVFTEQSDDILRIADECGLDFVQLHGDQSEEFAAAIGPDRVIRVVRVKDEFSIDSLADYQSAYCYLLDTYRKGKPGGTGETFDWSLAILARNLLRKPIILAGGLNPGNVFDAILAVRPYAVDVSSGVESSPGRKDLAKVKEFIDHVREADDAA